MELVPATIEARWEETPTIVGLRLAAHASRPLAGAPRGLPFEPGQWIDLHLEPGGPAGGYSITTSPLVPNTFDLAIRHSPDHPITLHLTTRATVGERVWVSPAQGDVVFRPDMAPALVLIGAGIGITPLMSMVRHVVRTAAEVDVQLVYGASTPDEIPFVHELSSLDAKHPRVRCHFTVSKPGASAYREGRVDAAWLRSIEHPPDAMYVLCGPAGMIRDARSALVDLGVPAEAIRFERWALGGVHDEA